LEGRAELTTTGSTDIYPAATALGRFPSDSEFSSAMALAFGLAFAQWS